MQKRVEMCENILKLYGHCVKTFLKQVVTSDETWISMYDPETKRQSSQWKTVDSPTPQKAKATRSQKKVMHIVYFDFEDILCHAVPEEQSLNYSKVSYKYLYW